MGINVDNEVPISNNPEGSGKVGEALFMHVKNVYNRGYLAEVVIAGKSFFVKRSDLIQALKNVGPDSTQ